MSPLAGIQPLPTYGFTMPESKEEIAVDKKVVSVASEHSLPQSNQKALSGYDIKVKSKKNVIPANTEGKKMHDGFCAKSSMAGKYQNDSNIYVTKRDDERHDYRQDGQWSWSATGVRISGYPQCPVPRCVGHIPGGAMLINKHWI